MRCLLLLLPVLQLFLCQSNPQTTPLSQGTTSEQSYNPSSGGLKVPWKIPPHMVVKAHEMKDFIAVSSHGRDDSDVSSSEKQPSLLALIMRSIYLFFLFLPAILTSGMAYVSQAFRNTVWFGLVTHSMAGGGAAFIKWGQWASTRPDMLPEELCAALSTLHSNAPTHSYAFTQRQIQTEFGSSIEEVFDFFSSTPVASGSIAQVYLARLHGRKVAVKVRHPNVEEQINIDFRIMKGLAAYLESFSALSWINLSESLNQFSHTIASQTDLSVEGKHLYLFNENFKQWKTVSFPVPILLSNSVLVESWEEGTTIAEYTELFGSASAASASDAPRGVRIMPELAFFVVSSGVNIYLKMLLTDNLMHSDLHPGNIFVKQTDADGNIIPASEHLKIRDRSRVSNHVVLVDAGMVARLVDSEQENFIGLLQSMGRGRGDEAAKFILNFSARRDYTEAQRADFTSDMKALFERVCRGYHHNVNIGVVLKNILTLVRVHKITIDANYATLVMNALCLDSLAASLVPSYNVLDGSKQLLEFHYHSKSVFGLALFRKLVPVAQFVKSIGDFFLSRKLLRQKSAVELE